MLFNESKRLAIKLGAGDSVVVCRGSKTIRDVVKDAIRRGFDSALIIRLVPSRSGAKMRADKLKVNGLDGAYSWLGSIPLSSRIHAKIAEEAD